MATILSGAMLLRWLGQRHNDAGALSAAEAIELAVDRALADGDGCTQDIGGTAGTTAATDAVMRRLSLNDRR